MKKLFTFLAIMAVATLIAPAQVNEDFETVTKYEDIDLDGWINHIEAGSAACIGHNYNDDNFAYFNPYNSGDDSNIMWLVTPGVNLDEFENDSIKFELAYGYFQQEAPLAIKYSLDFDGTEGNIGTANWVDITDQCNIPTADQVTSTFTPFIRTTIDIDHLQGTIYVAFVYTGSGNQGLTTAVELDDIVVGNPKPQSRILSFSVPNQLLNSTIDVENAAISLTVYPETDVTSLIPEMELSEDATVSPGIGSAQDFTNPVKYTVTSSDGESVTEWTITVTILGSEPTSIYDLQFVSNPAEDDASPFVDEPVYTTGIVTYGSGSGSAYVQAKAGEWNGIYVYVSSSSDVSLTKGDSVKLFGTISEYYHLTEFMPDSVYTISDRKKVEATVVSAPLGESTEGVLVEVKNLLIKANGEDGYYGITASNDTVIVENTLFEGLALTEGESYDLTGVVAYTYSEYRLLPRSTSDIVVSTSVNTVNENSLSVYPNPVTNILKVKGANSKTAEIININGGVVKSVKLQNNRIDVSGLTPGVYMLDVDSQIIRFVKQ